jgi:ABC-2 type transport system permease protein
MKNTLLIARKDFRSYFQSPIAYIVIAVFLLIIGWMFFNMLSYFQMQAQQFSTISFGSKPTLSDAVVRPLFGNMNVILLFVVPFITMRLLAEERREHTVELLFTAPVRSWEIVLGKFLSALALVMVLLFLTTVYPIILGFVSKPDWGTIFTCYIGMLFVAAAYIGVGLFWSSRTENQIVAAVLSFGTLLFLWLISWAASQAGPVWSDVLNHISIISHFTNFTQGILETTGVVYYLSFIFFSLFLTNLSFDSDQWG